MFEVLKYLGKFHPVILHLPIGALYFTFILVVLEKYLKENFSSPIRIGLLFSFVFAIISCFLGYFLSLSGDYGENVLNLHMYLGISTAIFNGVLLYMHKQNFFKKQFFSVFGFTILLLTITGHYGGSMTHGEDFLKLPVAKENLVLNERDSINIYTEVIRPVLDGKCVKCHNQSKSNGKLLLTTSEEILTGGKSGSILTANNAMESHMYSYLTLPMDDKLHMPPKGNSQLKQHEIELIKYWIDSGASFDSYTKIAEEQEFVARNLASFFPKPEIMVSLPRVDHLENLQNLNFRLERNSMENNFIEAKFLGDKIENKHISALLKIKNQLVKLDLSNTDLKDNQLSKLNSLKNLKYLKLNNTNTTDKGLKNINKNLESLNLNDTDISYSGFLSFLEDSRLKNAYLWNTKITSSQQKMLKDNFALNLNFGVADFAKDMPMTQPLVTTEQTLFKDSLLINIYKALGSPKVRYTLDGTEPDSLSKLYKESVKIDKSLTFKAKAFKKGWKPSLTTTIDYVKTAGIIESYKLKSFPNPTYKNIPKLFDGVVADTNFRSGDWNGFIKDDQEPGSNKINSGDLVLEIDIPSDNDINSIGLLALTFMNDHITFPEKIELFDITFKKESLLYSRIIPKSPVFEVPALKWFKVPLENTAAKKVKLIVHSNKKLPKGHVAEGKYAWLFVSEIIFMF
tara:strand:- start:365 stop:2413 length:2049 start_codon:yes stop_codon:yes gene_type:complete